MKNEKENSMELDNTNLVKNNELLVEPMTYEDYEKIFNETLRNLLNANTSSNISIIRIMRTEIAYTSEYLIEEYSRRNISKNLITKDQLKDIAVEHLSKVEEAMKLKPNVVREYLVEKFVYYKTISGVIRGNTSMVPEYGAKSLVRDLFDNCNMRNVLSELEYDRRSNCDELFDNLDLEWEDAVNTNDIDTSLRKRYAVDRTKDKTLTFDIYSSFIHDYLLEWCKIKGEMSYGFTTIAHSILSLTHGKEINDFGWKPGGIQNITIPHSMVTKWLKEHLSKVELLFKNHKDLVESTTVHFDENDIAVGVSNKMLWTTVYHTDTAFKIIIRELLRQDEVVKLEEELALQQNLDDLFEKQESIIAAPGTPPADKISWFSNTNVKLSDQVFDKVMTLLLFWKSGGYLDESILKDIDEELEKLR